MSDTSELTEQTLLNGIMVAYKIMSKVFEVDSIKESMEARASSSTETQKHIQQENFLKAQRKSLLAVAGILSILSICSVNGTVRVIVDGEELEYGDGSIILLPDRAKVLQYLMLTQIEAGSNTMFTTTDYAFNYEFDTESAEYLDLLADLLGTGTGG